MRQHFAKLAVLSAALLVQPLQAQTPLAPQAASEVDPARLIPNTTFATRATFEQEVTQSKGRVLVYFGGATWCPFCRAMAPVTADLAQNAGKDYRMVNVDTLRGGDDALWRRELATRFGFPGVPTYMMFRDGVPVARQVGLTSPEKTLQWLEQALKATTPLPPPPATSAPRL